MPVVKIEVKKIRIKKEKKIICLLETTFKIDPEKHSKNMLSLVNCYVC